MPAIKNSRFKLKCRLKVFSVLRRYVFLTTYHYLFVQFWEESFWPFPSGVKKLNYCLILC